MMAKEILAMLLVFGVPALVALAYSPLGRALADRIRYGVQPPLPPEPDSDTWNEIERLEAELVELQQRVAFAERLLATPVHTSVEGGA